MNYVCEASVTKTASNSCSCPYANHNKYFFLSRGKECTLFMEVVLRI